VLLTLTTTHVNVWWFKIILNPQIIVNHIASYSPYAPCMEHKCTTDGTWWNVCVQGGTPQVCLLVYKPHEHPLTSYNWLVVWNICSHHIIGNFIIPTDFHSIILQRGWLEPTRWWSHDIHQTQHETSRGFGPNLGGKLYGGSPKLPHWSFIYVRLFHDKLAYWGSTFMVYGCLWWIYPYNSIYGGFLKWAYP